MSEASSSPATWSSIDDLRNEDRETEVADSSDRFEEQVIPDYSPFRISPVLSSKDLDFNGFKYQISNGFKLDVVDPKERIALPHPGRIDIYEESLKAGLRFSLHFLVIKFLNMFKISLCNLASNSWR